MHRRITLHQLAIFDALARHGNMTRAAAELHMTTPALSIQVRQLAEHLGAPLHENLGRRLYLTEAGERVEIAAREVLDRLDRLGSELADLQGLEQGRLRLTITTTAKYLVPRLLGEFCRQHPGIEVALEVLNREQCIRRLSDNRDDLYIMGSPPEDLVLSATAFMHNPLVVIAPADSPLAGERSIDPHRLAAEPFIMRERGSGTRRAVERFFSDHGITLRTRMTLGSNEAVKQAVAAGLGIAVLSGHTLSLDRASGAFAQLDVSGFPLMREWYAIHPKGKQLSPVVSAFLGHLMAAGDRSFEQTDDA